MKYFILVCTTAVLMGCSVFAGTKFNDVNCGFVDKGGEGKVWTCTGSTPAATQVKPVRG